MRVPFHQIFQVQNDGSITPRVPVNLNGVTMTPGVSFTAGVSFGGVDVHTLRGRDLDVEQADGVYVITGYFQ